MNKLTQAQGKRIPIRGKYGRGGHTLVDKEDFNELSKFVWWSTKSGYVYRQENQKNIYLHRYLLNPPLGYEIDHRNNDKRDNRKSNLRICKHQQNQSNTPLIASNKSGFKGVHFHRKNKNWVVEIQVNRKNIHIGCFGDLVLAAKAYDAAAIKYFGEFARTNFQL